MDAAYEISRFLTFSKFEDLPDSVIDLAKKEVLDTLANMVGGSHDEGARILHNLVTEWGGREESTIIGYRTRVPAPHAALVNGTMAFALEYDDVHEKGRLHAGIVVVPTALAVSELKQGVTGKESITALCAAVEFGSRLGMASKRAKPGFVMGGWDYMRPFTASLRRRLPESCSISTSRRCITPWVSPTIRPRVTASRP